MLRAWFKALYFAPFLLCNSCTLEFAESILRKRGRPSKSLALPKLSPQQQRSIKMYAIVTLLACDVQKRCSLGTLDY